jgi:hypothetical protein
MGLHLDPSEHLAAPAGTAADRREARPFAERPALRGTSQTIARGHLACPGCGLPLAPAGNLEPAAPLSCPFCERDGSAREFLRLDARGPAGAAVDVVARFG